MRGNHDIVNFLLTGGIGGICRNGGCHIPCITHFCFRSGIQQEQVSALNLISMMMIVQRLAVDGGYDGEG